MDRKTYLLVQGLIEQALVRRIVGCPDSMVIRSAVERGEPVPDHLLPGRMVMRCGDEERERLRGLESRSLDGFVPVSLKYTSVRGVTGTALDLSGLRLE